MPNKFSPQGHYDFKIVDENDAVVGHIRLKPNGIHWAPKGAHNWYGVSIEEFGKWMEENGKKKRK